MPVAILASSLMIVVLFPAGLLHRPLAQNKAQETARAAAVEPVVEIVGHQIGSDSYPMLDRKSPVITAESSEFPWPEMSRRGRRTEDIKSRGRLRSRVVIIDNAQWINLELRNNGAKAIKAVDWDFAFPRYESGQLILRYDVSSKVEIKPGGKKKLKQPLPPGAQRCQIVTVSAEAERSEQEKKFEAVCGQGFHDPSQLKQETVTIKRIEYADGSVWQRQEK
jgi:hypothetical protein